MHVVEGGVVKVDDVVGDVLGEVAVEVPDEVVGEVVAEEVGELLGGVADEEVWIWETNTPPLVGFRRSSGK